MIPWLVLISLANHLPSMRLQAQNRMHRSEIREGRHSGGHRGQRVQLAPVGNRHARRRRSGQFLFG